jgi:hypothetical protein
VDCEKDDQAQLLQQALELRRQAAEQLGKPEPGFTIEQMASAGMTPSQMLLSVAADVEELRSALEARSDAFDAQLEAASKAHREAMPEPGSDEEEDGPPPEGIALGETLPYQRLSDVPIRKPRWLWELRIPRAQATILEGDPGVGKSTVVCSIVALATTGKPWPGEGADTPLREPMNVLWLTAEDSPSETIRPRIEANGGDSTRVFVSTRIPRLVDRNGDVSVLATEMLRATVKATGATLVVLDPGTLLVADANSEAIVRPALEVLFNLGQELDATFIWIRHFTKQSDKVRAGTQAQHLGGGSIGLTAGVRSVLQVHFDREREAAGSPFHRVLVQAKSNLGPYAASVYFRYRSVELAEEIQSFAVEWDSEDPDCVVEDVLRANSAAAKKKGNRKARVEERLLAAFQRRSSLPSSAVAQILHDCGVTSALEKGPGRWSGWKQFCEAYRVATTGAGRLTTYTMLAHADFESDGHGE